MLALTRIAWVLMQETPAEDTGDALERKMELMGARKRREDMVEHGRRCSKSR